MADPREGPSRPTFRFVVLFALTPGFALVGCGASPIDLDDAAPLADMAAPIDLAGPPDDLTPACETCGGQACVDVLTDARNCGACGHACSTGATCAAGACIAPTDDQYLFDSVFLPRDEAQAYTAGDAYTGYAYDVDGDGKVDDGWWTLLDLLNQAGSPPDFALGWYLSSGRIVLLMDVAPGDGPRSIAMLYGVPATTDAGVSTMPSVDVTRPATVLEGTRTGARITALAPALVEPPVLAFELPGLGASVVVPIHVVRFDFYTPDAQQAGGILNGFIAHQDLVGRGGVVVQMAAAMTAFVQQPPSQDRHIENEKETLRTLFDGGLGGLLSCTNPDGTMGAADDGVISACELLMSPALQPSLTPDIRAYDDQGRFNPMPTADASKRDAHSIGLRAHAIRAHLQ